MMTSLRRSVLLLLALAAFAWPAVASAEAGPVHRALTGGLIDPGATTLYIEPPRQGMVIVYRDGEAVGWFVRPGYLSAKPNTVHGVVATRGTSMLFNAQLLLRPGVTQLSWSSGNAPRMVYQPAYRVPARPRAHAPRGQAPRGQAPRAHAPPAAHRPATPGSRPAATGSVAPSRASKAAPRSRAPQAAGSPRSGISAQQFSQLLRRLDAADDDHDRLRSIRPEASRHTFTAAQKQQILARFRSAKLRDTASSALATSGPSRSIAPSRRPALVRR